MVGRLEGKVALVTGGSSGIGRATALRFARDGTAVAVAARRVQEGEETVQMIRESNGEATFVKTDVSKAAETEAMVNKVIETYGQLNYAFNNAGISGSRAPTAECTQENWDRVININLKGVWLCMKYEIPQLLKQGGGAIVNMSSVAGLVGGTDLPAYFASKHGVVGLTKAAALEYAQVGIRANVVCPGIIRTPMTEENFGDPEREAKVKARHPIGRVGTPEEVAEVVVWLCSDGASFVTGHAMPVDGGWVAQ